MSSFGLGFSQGLNLQPASNILAQGILRNAEIDKQNEEADRQRKIQEVSDRINQNIMGRIQNGYQNTLNQTPTIQDKTFTPDFNKGLGGLLPQTASLGNDFGTQQPFETGSKYQEGVVPEDKMSLSMELAGRPGGNELLNAYEKANEKLNPKTKYQNVNGNLYQENSDGSIDPNNPVIKKKVEPVYDPKKKFALIPNANGYLEIAKDDKGEPILNPKYDPPETFLGEEYDPKLNKTKIIWGKEDPNGDYTDKKTGIKYRTTPATKWISRFEKKDGVSYMSKGTQKLFDKYIEDIDERTANHEVVASGQTLTDQYGRPVLMENPTTKTKRPINAMDTQRAVWDAQTRLLGSVTKKMPTSLKKVYDDIEKGQEGKGVSSPVFWREIISAHKAGALSEAGFQYARVLHVGIFGKDPIMLYGAKSPTEEHIPNVPEQTDEE